MTCTYIAIYNGKQIELEADSLYAAKKSAVALLKVPMSKMGLLGVYLVAKGDEPVEISTASL